ncbi:MAG: hypothetical protein JGK17_14560 [Microcoleus sp. PH2017_10_PVI_O_A]|nr:MULTISPECIES: hypothetical protein [unclassified Microcoleus]MCC3406781.1 hypothetical protein [Microcoleus sp. PH2017_10_PVI_O_A]MCC3460916.1 hypothetical protein [Microcoleus sp. PH2017_11_PCY_U_A]MCC3479438.1 hypothetical protein [Microcoleus sp. PH2017_12_PCY_D_A]MCC3529367.1 hypothetical protein [Microcoleus sp. PH2017_21_RUC_O_A]MCC3541569.1 hypothetical protein [Microcoleus sp. PH2017_22_RUC_O_B]
MTSLDWLWDEKSSCKYRQNYSQLWRRFFQEELCMIQLFFEVFLQFCDS